MDATLARARAASPRAQAAAWAVFTLLAVVLLRPALTPAHVEGFSASIVSLGLHIAQGHTSAYDQVFPANLEFFGLSRLGAALGVAALVRGLGIGGELAMRLLMWTAFVVLAVSSWSLVRRWAQTSALVAAASLLVIPGPAESAFFYNDNVLSSALAVSALALLVRSRRVGVALLAGLLFGLAVVTRTDAVLLGPAVLLVLFDQEGVRRPLFVRGAVFGVGALLPVAGLFGLFHATIFDVLRISRHAVFMWARGLSVNRHIQEAVLFVGLPGAVLMTLGTFALIRRRDYRGLALAVGVPLVFNIVCAGKLWQARQLLPLTPLLAVLIARGWEFLANAARRTPPLPVARAGLLAVVALTFAVLASPVRGVVGSDGPHARVGRIRATGLWRRWQRAVNTDVDRIGAFTAAIGSRTTPGHPTALVTDEWNQDRFIHLALQEAGYAAVTQDQIPAQCRQIAELFRRGDRDVLHLRVHEPFLQSELILREARLDTYGVPCLTAVGVANPIFVASTYRMRNVFGPGPLPPSEMSASSLGASTDALYEPTAAVALTAPRLTALRQFYTADSARFDRWAVPSQRLGGTLPEAARLMAAQVAFPDGHVPADTRSAVERTPARPTP